MGFETGEGSKALYTGLAKFSVVDICPINKKTENGLEPIVYTSKSEDGVQNVRIDFHLEYKDGGSVNIKTKSSYFLKNMIHKTSTGKFEYIDKYGKFAYAESDSELNSKEFIDKNGDTWFDKSSARKTVPGEKDLTNFIRAYLNANKGKQCRLDNISNLFKNDLSEIRALKEVAKNNKLWLLATVKNEKYQNVSSRFVFSGWMAGEKFKEIVDKFMADNAQHIGNLEFQKSLKLQEYIPKQPDFEIENDKDDSLNELNAPWEDTSNQSSIEDLL